MTFNPNFRVAILFASVVISLFLHELNSSMSQNASDAGKTMTKILDSLFNRTYDKRVRPNYGGEPVNVSVSMIIQSLSISEVQMELTSHFYFRQTWHDSRLSFEPESGINQLIVDDDVSNKIWIPDTFFVNEILSLFHDTKVTNSFLRVYSSGKVSKSMRVAITTSCPMNLQYFPLDRQSCAIHIESYGYPTTEIAYSWDNGGNPVVLNYMDLDLPQFRIGGRTLSETTEPFPTGNYSLLKCEINFERALGYYLIQIYIPAALIVVMSWIAFWLNRKATGARVGVGVTTVLTITTLMSTTNSTLPKISYIKAIDIYLGTCFVIVFSSFVESAIVGYVTKKIEMRAEYSANDKTDNKQTGEVELTVQNTTINSNQLFLQQSNIASEQQLFASKTSSNLFDANPSNFDKYSRVLFPVCFLLFNIIYWIVYLILAKFGQQY